MPYIDYNQSSGLIMVIEKAKEWVDEYPERIKLCYGE